MRTLLVIDDHALVRGVLEVMLTTEGFAVQVASDGVAALANHTAAPVDGTLIDVDMPGLNGVETCRELRALYERRGWHFRAWLMTGVLRPGLEAAAKSAGALGVLAKPFTTQQLTQHVAQLLATSPERSAA